GRGDALARAALHPRRRRRADRARGAVGRSARVTKRFWSNVWAIAFKEARVLRNDPAVVVMMLIQPVVMVLLFGGVVSNTPAHTPWAVLDRAQTETSRRLVEAVQTTGYFVPPRPVSSYREAEALIARARAPAALVIPEDFERDLARRRKDRVHLLR